MLFVFAKNGLYYQFLSNTFLKQKKAKLLHKYGLSHAHMFHKEEIEMRCPMYVKMQFVYILLEKWYNSPIPFDNLRKNLEDYYGPINRKTSVTRRPSSTKNEDENE